MTSPAAPATAVPAAPTIQANICNLLPDFVRSKRDAVALAEADAASLAAWKSMADRIELRTLTWGELEVRVARAAGGLKKLGFEPGDRAMIFVPMSIDLYIAMCGVFWLGGISVFLDSFARQHQLGACSELVQPKAFIGDTMAQKMRPMMGPLAKLPIQIVTGTTEHVSGAVPIDEVVASGEPVPLHPVTGDQTALVTFTTGSSGTPKGANRTHEFLYAQHVAINKHIPYETDAVDIPAFPIFLLNNLAAGITTVMPAVDLARPADRDPEVIVSQVLHSGVTHATMSPAMLHRFSLFCIEKGLKLELRRMVTGGAPVTPAMIEAYAKAAPGSELMILYGSTEAEPMCHITGADTLALMREPDFGKREGVCVGESVRDMPIRLVRITRGKLALGAKGWAEWDVRGALPHDAEASAGRGEVGEVLVAGEHVCKDYFRNPEATAQNKISDGAAAEAAAGSKTAGGSPPGGLAGEPGVHGPTAGRGILVWHRTGDLGRWDEKGRLWMVGRVHNVVVRNEMSFFPVKAEIILKDLPFVKHGAFVGIPDARLGERTAACFVPKAAPADATEAAARLAQTRERLEAGGFAIDAVHALEKIPMDPRHHSKVDYDELRRSLVAAGLEK